MRAIVYSLIQSMEIIFTMLQRKKLVLRPLALLVLAFDVSQAAFAAGELWPIPAYCKGRDKEHWSRVLGKGCFEYGNHYCYGMARLNQYFAQMGGEPSAAHHDLLSGAVSDFEYLEKQLGPNCPQQPDIWLAKGRVHNLLKQPAEAARSFEKAVRKKPTLVPAYLELASLYFQAGQKDVARKILEHGVQVNPTNVNIKRRLNELGGQASDAAEKPAKGAH